MADFTTANLPGANEAFNTARDKFSNKGYVEVQHGSRCNIFNIDITI